MKKLRYSLLLMMGVFGGSFSVIQGAAAAQSPWQELEVAIAEGNVARVKQIVPKSIHVYYKKPGPQKQTALQIAQFYGTAYGGNPKHVAILNYFNEMPQNPAEKELFNQGKTIPRLLVQQPKPSKTPIVPLVGVYPLGFAAQVQQQHSQQILQMRAKPKVQQPAALPVQPAVADQFSIFTGNVLKEYFYEKNFMPKQQYTDRLVQRDAQFKSEVNNLKPDIIALQEYDDKPGNSPQLSAVHPFGLGGFSGRPSFLYLGAVENKFDLVDKGIRSFTTPGATDRAFMYLILNSKGSQENVGVITTQLKGGGGPNNNLKQFRNSQLSEIITLIGNYEIQGITKWILAGDFNWAWGNDVRKWLTDNGFSMSSNANTLYEKGHGTKKDYILYKGLQLIQSSVNSPINQLLTHSPQDQNKTYYSDHASLMATFGFGEQAEEKKQAEEKEQAGQWSGVYDVVYDEFTTQGNPDASVYIKTHGLDVNLKNPKTGKSLLDIITEKAGQELDQTGQIGPWYNLLP